jgi:parallel beta-helix repeat protein
MKAVVFTVVFVAIIAQPITAFNYYLQPQQTIQSAIDNAQINSTIYIPAGWYHENIIINKTIHLVGEDPENTRISGNYMGSVVVVTADDVSITNFTIMKSSNQSHFSWNESGIYCNKSRCIITHNIFRECVNAISLYDGDSNVISSNVFDDHYVLFPGGGILLHRSNDNIVAGNFIRYATGNGIHIVESNRNSISNNYIHYSYRGLLFQWAENNIIYNNDIRGSRQYGIELLIADNNLIFNNTLINNTMNAIDHSNNSWDNGIIGNYWDDYTGNGTYPIYCFEQYQIPCGNNTDFHPIVNNIFDYLPWDIVTDYTINYLDLSHMLNYYRETGNPGWVRDDINDDGMVNYLDSSIIANHYGETY